MGSSAAGSLLRFWLRCRQVKAKVIWRLDWGLTHDSQLGYGCWQEALSPHGPLRSTQAWVFSWHGSQYLPQALFQESKLEASVPLTIWAQIAHTVLSVSQHLLVTQVNPVHFVRELMRTWKGSKDYWELFGECLHSPPVTHILPHVETLSAPTESSWVSFHCSSSLKSRISSSNSGPGTDEATLQINSSSQFKDLRTKDRLSIFLHKFKIWWVG